MKPKIYNGKISDTKVTDRINIVIADDHFLVRQELAVALMKNPIIKIVGEFDKTADTIESISILNPDVVLLDVSLPDMKGNEALKFLLNIKPDLKVIILMMEDSRELIPEFITNGAKGYFFKNADMNELITAIINVHQGKFYDILKERERKIEENRKKLEDSFRKENTLTEKEKEVLICVVYGMTSKQISDKLSLSVRTVETHRYNIKKKLNINSKSALRKYAIEENLIKSN